MIHDSVKLYGKNILGEGCQILENVIIGYPLAKDQMTITDENPLQLTEQIHTTIGNNALIRSGTIIYSNVKIGNNFRTGHNALIRENTIIGDNVLVGSNVIIEGNVIIGNNVSIQSNVFIPVNTVIEDMVFIGPSAALTNDKYPPMRIITEMKGPRLRRGASIGANVTILPGIEIGEGSMIAAGAVVTADIPPFKLAIGNPTRINDLPKELKKSNITEG
jgi:acetyltransferase-like isoleucine patch superfamily enzyme